MNSSLFLLLLVGLVSAQNPTSSQVILGGDGHGQLNPTPLDQSILRAGGHGTYVTYNNNTNNDNNNQPSSTSTVSLSNIEGTPSNEEIVEEDERETVPALLGADGHGIYNPEAATDTAGAAPTPQTPVVTSTSATPEVVVQFDNTSTSTGTQLTPDVVTQTFSSGSGSGSGTMPPAVIGHNSFWTFTHYNNDSVCWQGFGNNDDDDFRDLGAASIGSNEVWCASSTTWHVFTFGMHAVFWSVAIMMLMMACTVSKRGRENRELRQRIAVMEISGMEYGDFVHATTLNDDRIELVPPSYGQFPEKPQRLGGSSSSGYLASVA